LSRTTEIAIFPISSYFFNAHELRPIVFSWINLTMWGSLLPPLGSGVVAAISTEHWASH
jgi:hypothetical protein